MGQYLNRIDADTNQALQRAENELAGLTKSREWQAAQTAADVAGIVDPSPTSDAISLSMSVAEGDWVGAFLSGVSFIPYFGDAVAKPIKIARATKAIAAVERRAAALAKQIAHYKSVANRIAKRKMAAAAERARRAKEAAAKSAGNLKCVKCPSPKKSSSQKSGNRFGTHLPKTGTWTDKKGNLGEKGDSIWTSKDKSVSIEYKEGYPDFSTSQPSSLHPDGGGKVEIEMKGNDSDFRAARDAMRDKLGDPKWPHNGGKTAPPDYTWHHKEDGVTMELVHRSIHDKAMSGAAHSGGASIVSGKHSQF